MNLNFRAPLLRKLQRGGLMSQTMTPGLLRQGMGIIIGAWSNSITQNRRLLSFVVCLLVSVTVGGDWMPLFGQTARFAYVANGSGGGPGSVSAYTIDGNTGALTPIPGSPFPAGSLPRFVTVDPSGRFLYVPNSN